MKILAPLSNIDYIDKYITAGADELYLGFHDDLWHQKFGQYADINRMSGFIKRANPFNFEDVINIIKYVKNKNKCIYVTINANAYNSDQIRYIKEKYFIPLKQAGVDGVILSDINVILAAIDIGINPIASTMCSIYNEDIAKIYKELGVKRMILPRDLSLDEIQQICEKIPDIHFEAFFMRNGCIFSDSYCLGLHRKECGGICAYTRFSESMYSHNYTDFNDYTDVDVNDYLYRHVFHIDACAMCALYRLSKIGIKSLKIVGRADDWDGICKDIKLTKENMQIMKDSGNEKDYLDHMIFPDNFPQKCRISMSCYYPEIRFNRKGRE